MRILFDIGHAAHVHLFKHLVRQLRQEGHEIIVVSREKPYVLDLLKAEGLTHQCLSVPGRGFFMLFIEWIRRTYRINKLHKEKPFDLAIGTSVSISYLSLLHSVVSINVQEDDDAVVPLHALLAYPFSTHIVNPQCLSYRFFRKKRMLHSSLHEMAYLHPDNFTPEPVVLEKYGFQKYSYIVIRKVSLIAHHDYGETGLSHEHMEIIKKAFPNCDMVISNESKKVKIAVEDMHSIIAYARLVVTDSQTMTAEAAFLGVPVIRVSSFKGRLSYLNLLDKLGFSESVTPEDLENFSSLIKSESGRQICDHDRRRKREEAGHHFPNFTQIMKNFIYGTQSHQ